jgi:acyl-coenzyme A synthetase/AMP-(fatty) acid ligase
MAYGQTEAGMRISQFPLDDPRAVMGCLGTPLEHFEWQLRNVDPDTKAGVFYIKGPAVMNGYITFEGGYEPVPADGFHCTNDLLLLGEDGQLYFNGRANDCFKTGGKVVNPHLIETIITELDGVDMAYCYPIPHKILDFTPVVDVVLKESAAIETGAIMEYCQSRLLPHEIPKEIRIRASLPLTPSGKIKRSGAG